MLSGGPATGVWGPLRLLLPGAGTPAMPAARQYLKESRAVWTPQGRRARQTARAPPRASGAGATPLSPRANQLPTGWRAAMTHIRARRGALLSTCSSRSRPAPLYSLL